MADTEKWTEEEVRSVQWWTDSLFSFTISRPQGYDFVAGQYSRLGLQDDEQVIWRAYSVVSAPVENSLEYYGVTVPGGGFTSRVSTLCAGAAIKLDRQPFGFMTPDRFVDGEALWMLATGTGLGPFISILRDGKAGQRFSRLVLVHCARHANELSYTDELKQLRHSLGDQLQVVQSVTREPLAATPDNGLVTTQGRITTLIEDGTLERLTGVAIAPDTARVMLCGNPAMIDETRALLHARGMRPVRRALPGQFLTENYW